MIAKNLYYKNMIEIAVNNYLISSPIAERTRDLYRHYLFKFIEWAVENDVELETAQAADVAAWFAEHKSWSASTKHTASAAIREFYRFQYGETHTMTRLKVKRTDPGPQRTLDEEETLALMAACEPNTPKGIRDLAIIALMTDTGLRATEIATAKLSRLDIRNSRLGVRIKGGGYGRRAVFRIYVCLPC